MKCFKHNSYVLLFQMHIVMLMLLCTDIEDKIFETFFVVHWKLNFSKVSLKETVPKHLFSDKTHSLLGNPS